MTTTQIATTKNLYRRIRNLSADNVKQVIRYIDDLEGHEPNEETIAAMREAENLDNLTTCTDLQDMLKKCGIRC